jgi:prepilin-type N-terminal cleavage/methylation domain-containing protein
MGRNSNVQAGLTLIELLVVIGVLALLAALLLPALSGAKRKSRQTVCMNHLRQINLGVRMYSDDAEDALPHRGAAATATNRTLLYSGFKELMKDYVGVKGESSGQDKLFSCPADVFYPSFLGTNAGAAYNVRQSLHQQPVFDFSSYVFNGGDSVTQSNATDTWKEMGLTGRTLSSIQHPSRTILVSEASATVPWSWHNPQPDRLQYGEAQNMVSFVDGHAAYVRIYWKGSRLSNGAFLFAVHSDPPSSYDYQWSAD